jgi:hypothetical protein
MNRLDLSSLDSPFSDEELWEAIKDMPSEKAPGPDGFILAFYRKSWAIIRDDLVAVFNSLHAMDSRGFNMINGAHTVLIPKKPGAREPGDFRPTSLVRSLAIFFSKVLARRLGPVLPRVVGENQGAFLKGRSLHDNFSIVRESVRFLGEKKYSSVLLKLDIAKTFDTVAWQFLLEILQHKGSGLRWCAWVIMLQVRVRV